jgi:hypothetical protein
MALIQNDHMVKQVSAAVAYPSLCNAILPRTAKAGSLWLDPKALDRIDDLFIKVAAAIEDQLPTALRPRDNSSKIISR